MHDAIARSIFLFYLGAFLLRSLSFSLPFCLVQLFAVAIWFCVCVRNKHLASKTYAMCFRHRRLIRWHNIFLWREHMNTFTLSAVIWSIAQEHPLQWKPHDVCSQQPPFSCCLTISLHPISFLFAVYTLCSLILSFRFGPKGDEKLLCSRHMIFHTFSIGMVHTAWYCKNPSNGKKLTEKRSDRPKCVDSFEFIVSKWIAAVATIASIAIAQIWKHLKVIQCDNKKRQSWQEYQQWYYCTMVSRKHPHCMTIMQAVSWCQWNVNNSVKSKYLVICLP